VSHYQLTWFFNWPVFSPTFPRMISFPLSLAPFLNLPTRARGNEYLGQKSSPAVGWCLRIKSNNSRSRSFHGTRIDGLSKAWACFCYVTYVPSRDLPIIRVSFHAIVFQLHVLSVCEMREADEERRRTLWRFYVRPSKRKTYYRFKKMTIEK